jgi:hypothetical protein
MNKIKNKIKTKSSFLQATSYKLLATIIFFLLATRTVYSQSVTRLIALPPRVEDLSAAPGEVITHQIKIKNAGGDEMVIRPDIKDFIVQDKKGRPTFLNEEITEHENRWAMSQWMTVSPAQFVLQPGETEVLDLIIVVPEDAVAGGHYAAVIYRPDNEATVGANTSGAQINPSVAALIYLTVEGDITEDARVTRLDIPKFSEFGPIDIETEITNFSDVHIKPKASINIYNIFNQLSKHLKVEEQNIFPSKARIYENTWDKKWLFGRFKAELIGSYGSQGQALQAVTYFWVVPWKVILAVLLALTLVVLTIVYWKKKTGPEPIPDEDLTPEKQ